LRRGFRGGRLSHAADSTVNTPFNRRIRGLSRGLFIMNLELPEGIEPSSMDYKAIVLPLN